MRFYSAMFGANVANFFWALTAGNRLGIICAVIGAIGSLLHEVAP